MTDALISLSEREVLLAQVGFGIAVTRLNQKGRGQAADELDQLSGKFFDAYDDALADDESQSGFKPCPDCGEPGAPSMSVPGRLVCRNSACEVKRYANDHSIIHRNERSSTGEFDFS